MLVSSPPPQAASLRKTPQAVRRSPAELPASGPGRLSRWRRQHWLLAGLLGATVLVATLVVPGFAGATLQPERVNLSLEVPPQAPSIEQEVPSVAPPRDWQMVQVRNGQTLGGIFDQLGLPGQQLHRLLGVDGMRESLTRIRPGDEFAFLIGNDGQLQALRFDRDEATRVVLHVWPDRIEQEVEERQLQRRIQLASGEISDSLYAAGERAGMSSAAILELAKVFGYDIDFAQDLRVGDRFDVIYEEVWRDGERLRQGDILAATFINQGKQYQVFRYQFADGRTEYFDADGRPTRKSFLRMPIDFARISSRFTSARKHPVLGITRAHKGVDYAARTGTPIMAAGDGKVLYAGWKNGFGRTVILDHGNRVTTLYGHMSRLGKYKAGSRVRQGDVIGYVGASGLASGPHLHYEFRIAGAHRDPLKVTLPKPQPLPASELARFRLQSQPMLAQLELLAGGSTYARR